MDMWMEDVRRRLSRHNQILFSRESPCLQELLGEIRQHRHRTLVLWAFRCVQRPLAILRAHLPQEDRPQQAVALCRRWAAGEVKMPIAKKALLQAHQAAKELTSPEDIALCHAVGQACATVHVETHAIGLPVYELTAIVRRFGPEACEKPVEERIAAYLSALPACAQEADDGSHRWAPFLLDDSRPNKEQLLLEKRGGGFPANNFPDALPFRVQARAPRFFVPYGRAVFQDASPNAALRKILSICVIRAAAIPNNRPANGKLSHPLFFKWHTDMYFHNVVCRRDF